MQHQTRHVKVLFGIWAKGAWAFACVNSIFHSSQAWGDEGHWGRALESTQTQLTVLSLKEKNCSWYFFPHFWQKIIGGKYLLKNTVLLAATHPQTTCTSEKTAVLCLLRTSAMWMLPTHLPFLPLCRTEFWDCNLLFPSSSPCQPLGKVPVWNSKWISRKQLREREMHVVSLIQAPF